MDAAVIKPLTRIERFIVAVAMAVLAVIASAVVASVTARWIEIPRNDPDIGRELSAFMWAFTAMATAALVAFSSGRCGRCACARRSRC